jgi:alpha-beta hydrolase superfamily lysophospholipase
MPLKTLDGLTLHTHSWVVESPRAVICLVHGLGEHSGRYEHVARFFNENGISFAAFDLRGHGKSEGKRGHAEYQQLMDDITLFLQSLDYDCPKILYGHSMGGNLALNYILRYNPDIAGGIISAPFLDLARGLPGHLRAILKILNVLTPSIQLSNGIDPNLICREKRVVEAYVSDPLVHTKITPRLVFGCLEAGKWALENADKLKKPILLIHGTGDGITSYRASQEFAKRAGKLCKFVSYEGFYHEPHNEPEKEKVLSDMLEWIEEVI